MNLLFVCSRNRLRSPTAEAIFSGLDGYEVLSAGTSPDAETIVSGDLVEWADTIFVMEGVHRRRLMQRFGSRLRAKRLIVLGVADEYSYMDSRLVELLRERVFGILVLAVLLANKLVAENATFREFARNRSVIAKADL